MATDAEVKQIDVSGDGGVLKRVLQEGHGSCPPQRSKVFVHYTGRLLDGTVFDSSVERNQPFEFDLGKGRVIKGWDLGVAQMKLGEKAILTCREDYAYGKSGSPPKIPPNATLQFEVELLSFDEPEEGMEKEDWEMTFEEKLEALEKRKAKGNELYRQGKYEEAAERYKKAVDLFDKVAFDVLSEEQKAAVAPRRSAAALNLAQASLKLSAAADAIQACSQVLEGEGGNVKALFRRGQAHLLQGNYALAKADLSAALKHEPANAEISAELERCNLKEREYRQKEKKMFGKMFA